MYVAAAKLTLAIGESHSLKDKRMVLRRIKDRVRERVGVTVNEVGALEQWQRSELGVAVTSGDRGKALELIDEVVRVAMAAGGMHILEIARSVTVFDAEPAPFVTVDERTGAADKALGAQGESDGDWIPAEWREEAGK